MKQRAESVGSEHARNDRIGHDGAHQLRRMRKRWCVIHGVRRDRRRRRCFLRRCRCRCAVRGMGLRTRRTAVACPTARTFVRGILAIAFYAGFHFPPESAGKRLKRQKKMYIYVDVDVDVDVGRSCRSGLRNQDFWRRANEKENPTVYWNRAACAVLSVASSARRCR